MTPPLASSISPKTPSIPVPKSLKAVREMVVHLPLQAKAVYLKHRIQPSPIAFPDIPFEVWSVP
ncbi:MAG: hypothetical protein HC795_06165 [Coleofasciculaceae cyanobacterium RL_1_1]|nr:hypothetical protein [Coleofasciculaceae cyanobacterium RL_1_1]